LQCQCLQCRLWRCLHQQVMLCQPQYAAHFKDVAKLDSQCLYLQTLLVHMLLIALPLHIVLRCSDMRRRGLCPGALICCRSCLVSDIRQTDSPLAALIPHILQSTRLLLTAEPQTTTADHEHVFALRLCLLLNLCRWVSTFSVLFRPLHQAILLLGRLPIPESSLSCARSYCCPPQRSRSCFSDGPTGR